MTTIPQLTPEEQHLLTLYRNASEPYRTVAYELIETHQIHDTG